VQGLLVSWARRSEDLTFDKTDLLTELPCRSCRRCVRRGVGLRLSSR
jgi:hypothetical protein